MTETATHMDAKVIYQAHLDRFSRAQLSGDWEHLFDYFVFPYAYVTHDKTYSADTVEQAAEAFVKNLDMLRSAGMTDIVRLVQFAGYVGEDRIDGAHEVHILHHATHLMPPFVSRMTLLREDGVWKEQNTRADIEMVRGLGTLPKIAPTTDTTR